VDSPRSSGFQDVVRRRSSSSSFVQVLRMAPGSEGAPIEHSVMNQMIVMATSTSLAKREC
jgi:hypothetical protein